MYVWCVYILYFGSSHAMSVYLYTLSFKWSVCHCKINLYCVGLLCKEHQICHEWTLECTAYLPQIHATYPTPKGSATCYIPHT